MRYRLLGPSGLRVSELFLGTMTFGEDWGWGASAAECRKMFETYAEAGGNVIDTANKYTDGASERIVGELLGADRDRFVVTTKYTLSIDDRDPNAAGNHRKSLTRSLERSLQHLRTDYIDLLWVHIWDPNTPIDETVRALDDAVRAGKVLYVGISDTPAWVVARGNTLADLRGWSPFVAIQLPYSLVQREIERELLPMSEAFGLAVAAWSPLAAGVLTGKFTRSESSGPTRTDAASIPERDLRIAREVDAAADALGATSSQVALAWTMAQHPSVHPIIGARSYDQLVDNLGCTDVELPDELLAKLNEASAVTLGFPHDFMRDTRDFVFGAAGRRVIGRTA